MREKKIKSKYFEGISFDNKKVEVTIHTTEYGRKELLLTYGKEKSSIIDVWSYQKTASSVKEIRNGNQDTLSNYVFKQTQPMPGWFNNVKVMFIHPDNSTPNVLLVWCIECDEVEWISIKNNGIFNELRVSEGYADKFGLWPISAYEHT